jgi:hypothetical protein
MNAFSKNDPLLESINFVVEGKFTITAEDKKLIDRFIAKKFITVGQPAESENLSFIGTELKFRHVKGGGYTVAA